MSSKRTVLTVLLIGLTMTAGAAWADPKEDRGNKPEQPPTIEEGCVDIVGGEFAVERESLAELPNGTVLTSPDGTLVGRIHLAAPSCRQARYTLEVRGMQPLAALDGDGSTETIDPRQLPVLASRTVKGDELSSAVDVTVPFTDQLSLLRSPQDACVWVTGSSAAKGTIIDEAPDAGDLPVKVCAGGGPAVSSFK